MKIENIKINTYGNLKNKEINLEKINIIYGKNESGKSTLLNFIKNIFFGISKNKNGKNISDYEKYYPWSGDDFSGKIKYKLNNNNIFEIYRDFNKKNPEIYNEQKEEISAKFKIDKKSGNLFFLEQTGLDEDTFESTSYIEQKEVLLDNNSQGIMLQKIANLAESGEEDVSFKKAIAGINAMLLSEVGTQNSKDRPINIAMKNIQNYRNDIESDKKIKNNKFEIEEKIKNISEKIKIKKIEEKLFEKINKIIDQNKIKKEKIKIENKNVEENNEKIKEIKIEEEELKNRIKKYEKNIKNKYNKKINIIIFLLLIIINIINLIFIKNKLINIIILLLIPIYITFIIINKNKYNKKEKEKIDKINKENNEILNKIEILEGQVELLEKNNKNKIEEINNIENEIKINILKEKEKIINEFNLVYSEKYISELFSTNLELLIDRNIRELNELNLEMHKLELNKKNIEPKLEELLFKEEMLNIEEEKLEALEKKSIEFNMAKEILEDAYNEMKKNITPEFNKELSKNIKSISNGKYENLMINDKLIVELNNGQYISVDNLSIGTVEQIYLSLRLSIMEELSTEKMPIMLDETFAYYDSERLQAALEFLANTDHQVIIFTCTNREKEILDKLNINYNYIVL